MAHANRTTPSLEKEKSLPQYKDNRANNRGFGYARLIPLNQSAPTSTRTSKLPTLDSAEGQVQVHANCLSPTTCCIEMNSPVRSDLPVSIPFKHAHMESSRMITQETSALVATCAQTLSRPYLASRTAPTSPQSGLSRPSIIGYRLTFMLPISTVVYQLWMRLHLCHNIELLITPDGTSNITRKHHSL
jgi:hypothetical protein